MNIILIICKIRTERIRGECLLVYHIKHGFENKCDSRFTIMNENQTVFLHLTSLTPADSGNYNCECSYPGETSTVHLNITVEGKCWTYFSTHQWLFSRLLVTLIKEYKCQYVWTL
ncbi:hypothetical protein PAMP_016446 [Pampus punctatissimus]